jgi:hypothetical protein
MEDQDLKFSWTSFFLVTSFSFFLFALILKKLENIEPRIFIWTGLATLILGLINLLVGKTHSTRAEE